MHSAGPPLLDHALVVALATRKLTCALILLSPVYIGPVSSFELVTLRNYMFSENAERGDALGYVLDVPTYREGDPVDRQNSWLWWELRLPRAVADANRRLEERQFLILW